MKKLQIILILVAMTISTMTFAQRTNEPLKFDGKPLVEMELNGKKAWVLLDTGSDYTIINSANRDEYGYTTYYIDRDVYKVQGIGNKLLQLYRVAKAEIVFENTVLKGPVLAYDLSNIVNSINERTDKKIAMIMGLNMLQTYGFVIDLANNTVTMKSKMTDHLADLNAKETLASNKN